MTLLHVIVLLHFTLCVGAAITYSIYRVTFYKSKYGKAINGSALYTFEGFNMYKEGQANLIPCFNFVLICGRAVIFHYTVICLQTFKNSSNH